MSRFCSVQLDDYHSSMVASPNGIRLDIAGSGHVHMSYETARQLAEALKFALGEGMEG